MPVVGKPGNQGPKVHNLNIFCKLEDGVLAVLCHTVMGEQGVQEGAEHTALGCASVERQRGGDGNSHCLGSACQKVKHLSN